MMNSNFRFPISDFRSPFARIAKVPVVAMPQSAIGNRQSAMGFTLIETMVAAIIISLAVLSIVAAQQAYHRQTDAAQQTATALSLANEMREMMLNLPLNDPATGNMTFGPETDEWTGTAAGAVGFFDDLDDFAGPSGTGLTFSPPINAQRQPISDMTRWTQQITVENVDPASISGPAAANGSTDMLRVTVIVKYVQPGATTPTEITRLSWVVAAPQ